MPKRMTAAVGAVMVLILGTGVVFASHQFPDVPDSNTFHGDIDWLTTNGITNGYANGNFGPNDPVSRGQMAAFLHRYNTKFSGAGPAGPAPLAPPGLPVLPGLPVRTPRRPNTASSACSWIEAAVRHATRRSPARSAPQREPR